MPRHTVVKGETLTADQVVAEAEALITGVTEILPLPRPYLRVLLYSTKWDSQVLLESYYSDPERMFKMAGLTDPDTTQMEMADDGVGQECDICCLEPDDESSPFLSNDLCGHSFCMECWAQHVKSKVEEGSALRLACPASSCSSLLSDNLVEQVVLRDEKLLLKLTTKKAEAVVDRSPSLVWCPPGGCQGVVRLPADSLRTSVVSCSCGKQFCFDCGRAEHFTVPCLLVEGWQNQAYHQDVKMKFMVILTKKCPKCKVDIEKEGGCQYMSCAKCRTEFCWHCLAICPRHSHPAGQPCTPPKEDASTSRTVEAEDRDGLGEKDRFSLYQQKYRFLETNVGYLLLDTKERVRLYSLFSVAPNLLTEVEGQHPAQDGLVEEPGRVVDREREGGMEMVLEDLWGRREEQMMAAEEEDVLRLRRAMMVREELVQIQEAERLHVRNDVGEQVEEMMEMNPFDPRQQEIIPHEGPPQQPVGEEIEVGLGRLRAEALGNAVGMQMRILPGAGGVVVQAAGAPPVRLDAAGAVGEGAEVAPVAVVPAVAAAAGAQAAVAGAQGAAAGAQAAAAGAQAGAAGAQAGAGAAVVGAVAAAQEERRERRLRMMRFMLRAGGRRHGVVALSSHMKEWLRPIQSKHGRTKLVTVIQALDSCMRKHTGLDWQPLGHLLAAAKALKEAQRVAMYAQVFAFYLGCIPMLCSNQTPGSRPYPDPLDEQSGFKKRLYSDNDPRALDAIMFYDCLEQLEVALHSLSKELLVTVEASLLIRLWMDDRQDSVKAHVYDAPWSLSSAQAGIQERRSHIMDRMRIAEQRKEAIVRLMEEGFGERVWSFRAVKA